MLDVHILGTMFRQMPGTRITLLRWDFTCNLTTISVDIIIFDVNCDLGTYVPIWYPDVEPQCGAFSFIVAIFYL